MPLGKKLITPGLMLAIGCASGLGGEEVETDTGWGAADADNGAGPIRVVEVMPPGKDTPDNGWIEVRNTGNQAVDLAGWKLSFGTHRVDVKALGERAHSVLPGELAVVIDGDVESAGDDAVPAWVPVVTVDGDLGELMNGSRKLVLRDPDSAVSDKADATRIDPDPGVSLERAGEGEPFRRNVWGRSPGERNAARDDSAIQVWFTRPTYEHDDLVAPVFADVVGKARTSLHGAFYQINNMELVNALVTAKGKGRDIGIVTDDEWYFKQGQEGPRYRSSYGALEQAGIQVVYDVTREGAARSSALMHSKFMAIDGKSVWTGSYNLITEEQEGHALTHADNALLIRSADLAAVHEREYQEMFAKKRFGPQKKYEDLTDRTVLETGNEIHVDGARIDTFFAPKYSCVDAIVREIGRANSNVYFAAFSFYQADIGKAMADRIADGVDVRGVFYNASIGGPTSQYPVLIQAGADVRYPDPASPRGEIFLHHKFIILDYGGADPTVITGSFNFSDSAATKNDEAMYVIHDRAIAEAYYRVFRSLYDPAVGDKKNTTDLADVVITEVYSPAAAHGDDQQEAFVEILNRGQTSADLRKLYIASRDGDWVRCSTLVAGVTRLAAGERAVLKMTSDLEPLAPRPLVIQDDLDRTIATFDGAAYPGAGKSIARDDDAKSDWEVTWTSGDPTPGE